MQNVDLIIIGAGPAGCAAALAWLGKGHSVLLLETMGEPRRIAGETLHPAAEPLFDQLGVRDVLLACSLHRHTGIWHENRDGTRHFMPYGTDANGPWSGLQVDRIRLNALMRERVTKAGGRIMRMQLLEPRPARHNGQWHLMADAMQLTAPVLFDATGRQAWLARQLALRSESHGPEQRLRFGWFEREHNHAENNPVFIQRQDGWNWLAPLNGNCCAWAELRRESTGSGMNASWRITPDCAGDGYFLLGDAACYMDPSAANGVLRAIMSGIMAAHLASAVRQRTTTPMQAWQSYRAWIKHLFFTTLHELNGVHQPADRPSQGEIPQIPDQYATKHPELQPDAFDETNPVTLMRPAASQAGAKSDTPAPQASP